MVSRRIRRRRRGMGVVEWVVVAAAVLLVIVGFVAVMGPQVDTQLDTAAENVANPATLAQRYGN